MRLQLTFFLGFFMALNSFGQKQTLESLQERFKSQHAVYLSEKEHLHISTEGNEYSIYSDVEWEMMYLTDKGKAYGDQSIYYSMFTQIQNIKATSYLPKKNPNKYKKVKVKNFKTEDVYSSSYFFHDNKQVSIQFPGTQAGTKIKLSYREKISDPHFLGQNFFISFLPTLRSEYSVTFPKNVELKFKKFNTDSFPIQFKETEKKGLVTYTWWVENQDAYETVSNAPSLKYYAPHIVLYLGEIKLQDTTVSVLPDLDALFNWYNSLVKDVNLEVDTTLENITKELVKGVTSKDEKARMVFNWVQDNIKYVAFEDGMGGFIPRPAARVCRNRYGDCKDMSSIITEMLKYADVDANLTWIGSRELPYDYTEVATPVVDNHMIASYRNEKNEIVFLDAVGSYTPYGYPTGFIQGKQALIRLKNNQYEVARVPVISKELNSESDHIVMELNATKLSGKGNITTKGYSKLDWVYPLINKTKKERTTRLEGMLEKGNNKFKIQSATFEGIKDRDKYMSINYDFTIEDYVKTASDEYYVNLHLDRDFLNDKLDIEKRKGISVEFEYKSLDQNTVEMSFSEDLKVDYLPANSSFQKENFGYTITYTLEENKIIMKKNLSIDLLMLQEKDFNDWNAMMKKLNKAYKDVVVLKKK